MGKKIWLPKCSSKILKHKLWINIELKWKDCMYRNNLEYVYNVQTYWNFSSVQYKPRFPIAVYVNFDLNWFINAYLNSNCTIPFWDKQSHAKCKEGIRNKKSKKCRHEEKKRKLNLVYINIIHNISPYLSIPAKCHYNHYVYILNLSATDFCSHHSLFQYHIKSTEP